MLVNRMQVIFIIQARRGVGPQQLKKSTLSSTEGFKDFKGISYVDKGTVVVSQFYKVVCNPYVTNSVSVFS